MFDKIYHRMWIRFCLACFPFLHAYDFIWTVEPPKELPSIRLIAALGMTFGTLIVFGIVLLPFRKVEKLFCILESEFFENLVEKITKGHSFRYTLSATEKYIYAGRLIRRLKRVIEKESKKDNSPRLVRAEVKLKLVEGEMEKLYEDALILQIAEVE